MELCCEPIPHRNIGCFALRCGYVTLDLSKVQQGGGMGGREGGTSKEVVDTVTVVLPLFTNLHGLID